MSKKKTYRYPIEVPGWICHAWIVEDDKGMTCHLEMRRETANNPSYQQT